MNTLAPGFRPIPAGLLRPAYPVRRDPQIAQGDEDERELEETRDPLAEVRQAQWDARIDMLRRLDPSNRNLVYAGPPGAPSPEAVARLDAEVRNVTERVAAKIANGHAWARHAAEFPELSSRSQFAGVIERVIANPSSIVRELADGRTAFYESSTNTLVIANPNAPDLGTGFKPADGRNYVDKLD